MKRFIRLCGRQYSSLSWPCHCRLESVTLESRLSPRAGLPRRNFGQVRGEA
jgi:hypothetical protein